MKGSTPALPKTTWEKPTARDTCLSEVHPDPPQHHQVLQLSSLFFVTDATKITLAPSNADINQGENVSLQCHASHDPTMDLTFTWTLNGVLLNLEDPAGPYHRMDGVSSLHNKANVCGSVCVSSCLILLWLAEYHVPCGSVFVLSEGEYWRPDDQERSVESGRDVHMHSSDGGRQRIGGSETGRSR